MAAAKVLILMTSPLDKIVHALRVVESIKLRRPELEVTWVVRRFYEPLVASFDFVDRTIVFHRSEALKRFADLVREIRRDHYDYILDFEGYARTGALCFLARGGRKIGLRSAREGATICYSEVIARKAGDDRHLLERFQDFGSVFGLKAEVEGRMRLGGLGVLPEEVKRIKESGRRLVCLFAGRFKVKRAWPGMLELAARIGREHEDVEVAFLGVVPSVLEGSLPERVCDLRERLSWAEVCQVMAEADLVVANDNGPAQLAGAFGVRNLTLYSFVSPELRGSYPTDAIGNRAVKAPSGDVSRLDLEVVFAEVEKLLAL